MARQGVPTHGLDEVRVLDMITGEPVPADGKTMGEICVRGNTVMKGYQGIQRWMVSYRRSGCAAPG